MRRSPRGLTRPLALLRTVVRPGFLRFLGRRLATKLYLEITAFSVQSAVGPEGGVGRGAIIRQLDGLHVGRGTVIGMGAEIDAAVAPDGAATLRLGRAVRVGRRVMLATGPETQLEIGDYSSIHNNCILLGNVTIGRHCLLSNNVFMSSGEHFTRRRPPVLIKDQDLEVATMPGGAMLRSQPVVVDDDCWIGWGAVIRRGIHIGRGAVIGANSVVTRDVPPYEVHAGVPARRIGSRLVFEPPDHLDAAVVDHLPYFYSGFDLREGRRLRSPHGAAAVDRSARVVLRAGAWKVIRMVAVTSGADMPVSVRVNGRLVGHATLGPLSAEYGWNLSTPEPGDMPGLLGDHLVVTIDRDTPPDDPSHEYFVARIWVE